MLASSAFGRGVELQAATARQASASATGRAMNEPANAVLAAPNDRTVSNTYFSLGCLSIRGAIGQGATSLFCYVLRHDIKTPDRPGAEKVRTVIHTPRCVVTP